MHVFLFAFLRVKSPAEHSNGSARRPIGEREAFLIGKEPPSVGGSRPH